MAISIFVKRIVIVNGVIKECALTKLYLKMLS